jgi:hypothetical protein
MQGQSKIPGKASAKFLNTSTQSNAQTIWSTLGIHQLETIKL